jgi:hypothetical protein
MHYLADFDNQTKLLHVGYSVLGMLVSMLVLVKFKPTIIPRMVTAVILGFVLVYCLSTPLTGDQERLKSLYSIGWFSLGLLFGIGRGEFVIEYLTRKFFGAPDQLADQLAKAESADAAAAKSSAEASADIGARAQPDPHTVLNGSSELKAEADTRPGDVKSAE